MGVKMYTASKAAYFASFLRAAASAALPAAAHDPWRLLAASMSVTVTSQVTHLPTDHRIYVTPSGCLLSAWLKPAGYLTAGKFALFNARHMMSFKKLCLPILPALRLHASPCIPYASTSALQTHT